MKFKTAESIAEATPAALDEILYALDQKECRAPELLICAASCEYDLDAIRRALTQRYPTAALVGGTSCSGVMTERGHFAQNGFGLAVLAIEDRGGAYGGGSSTNPDAFEAGAEAARAAMSAADRPGERPEACFLISAPGNEERVLAGLETVIGADVPLIGGSSADNTLEGRWRQVDAQGVYETATVVALFYPSGEVAAHFHSGYDATSASAVVTKAEGRKILELDGRPAAEVYNQWTNGAVADMLSTGGVILDRTNLFPLGRQITVVKGEPYFVLSHPETITADGAITVFTDIAVGDRIICMSGSRENLIERAGNVAAAARVAEELDREDIAGSLVIFCAGCMMAVGDQMQDAHARIREELGSETPFLAAYTFGEQGSLADGANRHGNLMISVMHFADAPAV